MPRPQSDVITKSGERSRLRRAREAERLNDVANRSMIAVLRLQMQLDAALKAMSWALGATTLDGCRHAIIAGQRAVVRISGENTKSEDGDR